MPTGRTHTSATIIAAGALALGAALLIYQTGRPEFAALPIGALAGLLLSPDLDVERGSISNHHARRIGCVFGALWRWYWWPYAKIAKHRGLSHAPVLGTLIRLVYIGWWIPLVWRPMPWAWVGAFAVGLAIVDLIHIGMDWI